MKCRYTYKIAGLLSVVIIMTTVSRSVFCSYVMADTLGMNEKGIRYEVQERVESQIQTMAETNVHTVSESEVQIVSESEVQSGEGPAEAAAKGPDIDTPSAILMESKTGQIIYEKDATKELAPASITKIMTLILIFEAIEAGQIKMEDPVTVSEYAASMGGSQVFLEEGEIQSVKTMIKCIAVASANDACVAC